MNSEKNMSPCTGKTGPAMATTLTRLPSHLATLHSQSDAEQRIGTDLISRFQYYRIVRNWVVHTKESDIAKPEAKFHEIVPYQAEREREFRSLKRTKPACPLTLR